MNTQGIKQLKKGKKITVIGMGDLGSAIAFAITIEGLANEIVLIDINAEKAKGEATDILHGTPFTPAVNIYAGEYSDAANSDIVIITAGLRRKPGQSRLDLAQANINIMKDIIPQIVKFAPNAVYIAVTNPVDIITYTISKISRLPQKQIIGLGTMLDTARLRTALAAHTKSPLNNIEAYVLGEHGDTQTIPWSLASIAGVPVEIFCEQMCDKHRSCKKAELKQLEEEIKAAGAQIILNKGATVYGAALAVRRLCETIIRDSENVHTVSAMLSGEYGISDVCLSIPCIIGANGIKKSLQVPLKPEEKEGLFKSAKALKDSIDSLIF